ncbi:MAG: phenylalanine--tRNA ligase subunit beta [Actinomycetia bacterium]|nr:phenylalanine--tRNA ligase subunit beta [Actinomycetes bacterium]
MRVPLSWLREFAPVPESESGRDVAARLIQAGLEVETVDTVGGEVTGPLVIGRVLTVEELTEFKKPIRFCTVAVGEDHGHPDTPGERGIICGAANFAARDLVVIALPGSVLPGGFEIGSRKTYGRISDGMICSEQELGLGEDHDGIMVLPPDAGVPGDPAGPVLGLGEEVLDIAVTPDRGYALSIRGVAREAATSYGVSFTDPGNELAELPVPADDHEPHPCAIEDLAACDLFTLRTIVGFGPAAPTPIWMRRRLTACGMRSLGLAVDITNYVMLETGQPLHAFDVDQLRGPVRARLAQDGESLETLDHVERKLSADDLVIADDRGAIGLAGTMGGTETEISNASTAIALEAAHFADRRVARMSRRHKLSSEASRRFERGVDRELAPYASARAAALLLELGGGEYWGMTGTEAPQQPTHITIPADLPAQVGGLTVPVDTTVAHLREVGCEVIPEGDQLQVTPPSWRPDLTDPYDLVEEVLRLVGYDEIPSVLPAVPAQHGLPHARRIRRRVGVALAGRGFVETPAYPFLGATDLDDLGIPADDERRRLVRLANPLSDEQPFLRTTLLPDLIATARRNLSRGAEDLALFEQGVVFFSRGAQDGPTPRPDVADRPTDAELAELDALLPEQPRHVAVVLAGNREPAGWWGPARSATWADAVSAARVVADAVGVDLDVAAAGPAPFHPGRCAALSVAGEVVGHAGELHPKMVEQLGLPPRTAAMEIDLDALIAAARDIVPAPDIGTMPVAKEDIALIVAGDIPAADVAETLVAGGGDLVESVRLFDEYAGEQVGEGNKSLAFALRFRAPDRTLTAEEVAEVREAAVAAAVEQHQAVLRS